MLVDKILCEKIRSQGMQDNEKSVFTTLALKEFLNESGRIFNEYIYALISSNEFCSLCRFLKREINFQEP